MKVAVIAAMEEEIALLKGQLDNYHLFKRGNCEIYRGILNNNDVILLKSGIGKVAAAVGTTLLIEHFQPDIVINTGSAGGLANNLMVGDIVISTEVLYHDVDLTAFNYQIGQMAGCPATFVANDKLIEIASSAAKELAISMVKGIIGSGDAFINGAESLERIKSTFPKLIAVEMEAAAIAQVCHQFATPFIVVRAISDVADQQSHLSFDEFLTVAAQQSSTLVLTMLTQLCHAHL